jgi:hypothetical protein
MTDRCAFPPVRRLRLRHLFLAPIVLLAACDSTPVEPVASELRIFQPPSPPEGDQPELLVCPTSETHYKTAFIGPWGGSISLGGHSLRVPFGALQFPVLITLIEPASPYMEISVHVWGFDFFEFLLPVRLSISYERCDPSVIGPEPVQAWYIDEVTKELLENMNGVDDREAQLVRFRTGHLSGYALAQ